MERIDSPIKVLNPTTEGQKAVNRISNKILTDKSLDTKLSLSKEEKEQLVEWLQNLKI